MPIRPENRRRYPVDWPEISLHIRTVRAGGRCECQGQCGTGHVGRCEARNGGPHPDTGSMVVLTVAHLDHQPENCAPSNLMAACQRCHLAYDRDHHRQTAAATRRAALEGAGQGALFVEPVLDACEPAWQPRRRRPVVDVPGPDDWPAPPAVQLGSPTTKENHHA